MSSAPSRSFAIIPSDQRKLLSRNDSWAVDFGPSVHVHVPDHVLEIVEQAYRAKKDAIVGHYAAYPTQPPTSPPPEQGNSAIQTNIVGTDPVGSSQSSRSPEPSLPLCSSWPATPKRPLHVDSSIVRETPKAAKLRHQPRAQQLSRLGDVSGSSDVDDWEVSVPRAKADADVPVNRVAARPSTEATPSLAVDTALSCAQPSHAVTITSHAITNSDAPAKKEGRRGRHRSIKFSSSPSNKTTTGPIRMPATKVFADEPTSSSTSSGSVASTAPLSSAAVHLFAETSIKSSRSAAAQRPADDRASQITPPPPTLTPDHNNHSTQLQLPASRGESERTRQSPTPCVAFLAAYPDYVTAHSGSLQNFVKACVCLSYLQVKRLLREFLFDEFVRFFSGEYLSYVARAGPGQEPLPAIEWFNLQSGAPLYTHMVLSGENLDGVFAAYPEETRMARSMIEDQRTPSPLTIRQYQLMKKRQSETVKGLRDTAKKKKEAGRVKEL
ncbi:hypothetical protein CP532_5552 [Ophiocordyceps camponoti-leonardi (nom. inval.)]|nr:hypothetical protein CP532_5552 [Ophiocordyceps camponoti-leonardi (nom. inval.)]